MRLATLIVSLVLMVFVGVQSCAVRLLDSLGDRKADAGGAFGMLLAIGFLIGGAFVLRFPLVSAVVYALAGLLGLLAVATTTFVDLRIWCYVSFGLAALAVLGWRERRAIARRSAAPAGAIPPE